MKKKRNYHRYTDEEKDFLEEFAPGHSWQEIIDTFRNRFGAEISAQCLSSVLCKYGIRTNTREKYTEEEKQFLKQYIPGHTQKEIISEYKKLFEKDISLTNLKNFKTYYGLISGTHDRTRFKKSYLEKEVGDEILLKNGYVLKKISEEPSRWEFKHRYIWEQAFGKIPDGYLVVFADGNKENCDLNNLRLISRKTQAVMNGSGLSEATGEYFDTAVMIAELKQIQRKRIRDLESEEC